MVCRLEKRSRNKDNLNVFIANTKQGVGPQVFPTLVTALPLQYTAGYGMYTRERSIL